MLVFDAIVAGITGMLLLNLIGSLIAIRRLDTFVPASRARNMWPAISVLIPARNEAATIASCLHSLLAQDYPNAEFLVLDDASDDATAAIVTQIATLDDRVRLLQGAPLPPGWLGKCHACAQLAAAAHGDYLLFTDADTAHGPASLAQALAAAEQLHVGLIAALPRQCAQTCSERLIMPLLPFNILALLPVGLVRRRPEPSLSAGIGQFLFFHRSAYLATGGHAAIRDQVLDDVALARRVKAAGWRMDLLDGGRGVRCRMYTGLGPIWRGFSKNLYDFYGRNVLVTVLAVVARLAIFGAPPVLVVVGLVRQWPPLLIVLPLAAYLAAVSMRLLLAARVGDAGTSLGSMAAWGSALLHPLGELFECAMTLNSMWWGLRGHMVWKGRIYSL